MVTEGGRSPLRRRRSGRGRVLVGSVPAHSTNRRVPSRAARPVPWQECARVQRQPKGRITSISIDRPGLPGNGSSYCATLQRGVYGASGKWSGRAVGCASRDESARWYLLARPSAGTACGGISRRLGRRSWTG
jgi:hypothetical protein